MFVSIHIINNTIILWYCLIFVLINVCCSRTIKDFLDVVWQTLFWSSCFWGAAMVSILWGNRCIQGFFFYMSKLFFFTWLNLLLSSSTDVLSSGSFMVLLSLLVHYFILRIFQTVDLATPDVYVISLMVWFFSACLAALRLTALWILQQQIPTANFSPGVNSRPLTSFINEGIVEICPWNSFWEDYPSTFGPLTRGRHILTVVITIHLITLKSKLKVCI